MSLTGVANRVMSPISHAPDPQLEVVDQLKAGVDVAAPRIMDLEPSKQPAAADCEQVGHRDLVPKQISVECTRS